MVAAERFQSESARRSRSLRFIFDHCIQMSRFGRKTNAQLFFLRGVTLCRCAILVQMSRGPERAARDEIEVFRIFDCGVVMADRGAENAGFLWAVEIRPNHYEIAGPFSAVPPFVGLLATSDGGDGVEEVNVVIKLFVDGGPIR